MLRIRFFHRVGSGSELSQPTQIRIQNLFNISFLLSFLSLDPDPVFPDGRIRIRVFLEARSRIHLLSGGSDPVYLNPDLQVWLQRLVTFSVDSAKARDSDNYRESESSFTHA